MQPAVKERKGVPYRYAPEKRIVPPCPPDRYVEVGMVVKHYPDAAGDAKATCAMVTRVGLDAIDCHGVEESFCGMMPFSGVHHRKYQSDRPGSDGFWEPLPLQVAMLTFMIEAGALEWDGDSKYRPVTRKKEDEKVEAAGTETKPPSTDKPPIA